MHFVVVLIHWNVSFGLFQPPFLNVFSAFWVDD